MNKQYINDVIKSLNKDIDNMHNLNRFFVINNEEDYTSTLFMRTHDLSMDFITNFCIELDLVPDRNNQQILILQTQIKDMKKATSQR